MTVLEEVNNAEARPCIRPCCLHRLVLASAVGGRHHRHRRRHRQDGLCRRRRPRDQGPAEPAVPLRPRRQGRPLHRRGDQPLRPQGRPEDRHDQHRRRHRQEGLHRRRRPGDEGDVQRALCGRRLAGGRPVHRRSAQRGASARWTARRASSRRSRATARRRTPATAARATRRGLVEPNDCCLDGKGGLLIADVGDWRIRRLDLKTGTITHVRGHRAEEGQGRARRDLGDGGPATKAVIFGARAVCVDGKGNTYVCEREGNADPQGRRQGRHHHAGRDGREGRRRRRRRQGDVQRPQGDPLRRATGNVYVVDTENHSVRKIDVEDEDGDDGRRRRQARPRRRRRRRAEGGPGPAARLRASMTKGVLYIADSENHRVRRVKP